MALSDGLRAVGAWRRAAGASLLLPFAGLLLPAAPLLPTGVLRAQDTPPLELSLAPDRADMLSFRLGDILGEGSIREALDAGLPLRIVVTVELWKDRFFDSQEGREDWRATVLHDPLSGGYRLRTSGLRAVDATFESLEETRAALQRTVRPALPLRPGESGRYYYTGTLVVQTFSASDLEELQRWLRGDLGPAVAGEGDVDDALGEGARRLLVRLLGLPTRKYRTRTRTFEYPPPPDGAPLSPGPRGGR